MHFSSPEIPLTLSHLKSLSAEDVFYFFGRLLEGELRDRKEKGLDELSLKSYYTGFLTESGKSIPLAAFGYGQRFGPLIQELQRSSDSLRLLDAGCGYGTESILFSLLGARVDGVELVLERTELARSRISFYQSLCSFPLNLKFFNANIFKFLQKSGPYDIIWAMEAVSHIYPPEEFFALAYDRTKKGGKLVISDPNRLNPLVWLREVKIRGSIRPGVHEQFTDPETGAPVKYGQENRFSVFLLKKKLEKAGFKIQDVHMSGFLGSSFLPKKILMRRGPHSFLRAFQKAMKEVLLLNRLGSLYTIVAGKEK
jgi:SAM-dependent methyltransferase